MAQSLALVPVDKFTALVAPDELTELIEANMGGTDGADPMPLPRITLPTGGVQKWTLASPMGDELVDTLRVVILQQQFSRAFWPGAFGSAQRPQCSAVDGKLGVGDPAGNCATCLKRGWQGDNKPECDPVWRLWVLLEDHVLPLELGLGTTSQKPFRQYAAGLVSGRMRLDRVITEIGLLPAVNPQKINYSIATFKAIGTLPENVWPEVDAMKEKMASFRRTQSDLEVAFQTDEGGTDL